MKPGIRTAILATATLAASFASAQRPGRDFDFVNPPLHTVQLTLSQLEGRPGEMNELKWEGYYLYARDGRITIVSHRPTHRGDHFVGNAVLDSGRFDAVESYTNFGNERVEGRGRFINWSYRTREHYAGVTFSTGRSHYLAIELQNDYTPGESLPSIFVGRNKNRFKAGSGYVVIDLTR